MNPILETLGFIPLEKFIKEKMNLLVEADGIFVKCTVEVPILSIISAPRNSDILSVALEKCKDYNQIAFGYNKRQKEWYYTNTSRNLLKSKKWSKIFDILGFDYSVFILINCTIIERVGENFILICGESSSLNPKKEKLFHVQKETLFLGKCKDLNVDVEKAVSKILSDISLSQLTYEKLSKIFITVFSKFNKLPINSIFRSFFNSETVSSYLF